MVKRILILACSLLLVSTAAFAADEAPLKIVKAQKVARSATGTGLQGTISVGTLPAPLAQLSCKDLAVHVGILHSTSAALTSFASSQATGTIASGQCAYSLPAMPAGGPFDVVIVPASAPATCKLGASNSFGKVTLTRGAMSTLDVQLTPVCE